MSATSKSSRNVSVRATTTSATSSSRCASRHGSWAHDQDTATSPEPTTRPPQDLLEPGVGARRPAEVDDEVGRAGAQDALDRPPQRRGELVAPHSADGDDGLLAALPPHDEAPAPVRGHDGARAGEAA